MSAYVMRTRAFLYTDSDGKLTWEKRVSRFERSD